MADITLGKDLWKLELDKAWPAQVWLCRCPLCEHTVTGFTDGD